MGGVRAAKMASVPMVLISLMLLLLQPVSVSGESTPLTAVDAYSPHPKKKK